MGELGDDWRDVRYMRLREKNKRIKELAPIYEELCRHPLARRTGTQHRIETWDFWFTGTVYNYKTRERISLEALHAKYCT